MNRDELIAKAVELLSEELKDYTYGDNDPGERIEQALLELKASQVTRETVDLINQLADSCYAAYTHCIERNPAVAESALDEKVRVLMGDDHNETAGKLYKLSSELENLL